MSTFLYTKPSDNLAKTGVLTVNSGAGDPGYPPEYLINDRPDLPAKLTGTSGSWVNDLGAAKRIDFVPVINHNFDAGANVRIQGNDVNLWNAPSLNQAFTIPAKFDDGFTANVFLNLSTLVPLAANRTYRYWRLVCVSVNSAPVVVGEWPLYGTIRNFGDANIQRGSTRRVKRPAIMLRTPGLVKYAFDQGVTARSLTCEVQNDLATMQAIDAWFRDARGIAKPFTIVPNVNDDDAWFVSFTEQELVYTRIVPPAHNSMTLEFEELSRGLYL